MSDDESTVGGTPGGGASGLEPTSPYGPARRVGPYELIEELGRGGMGVVYKARRDETGAVVAIKLLSGHAIDDPRLRQRFLREARAAASISHPNIARVHGIFEDGPLLAIVMDYIPGGTLRSRIKRRAALDDGRGPGCDVDWILRITRQVALGLAAAHRAGVIHRDIKPSNVLLDPTGEHAWIADFGLAAFELGDDSLTSTNHQLGTPAYMSPEQARGERVDRRSDLFSLGCLVYAMVTGESPFQATNLLAVMRRISDHTPPSLADKDHRIPPALAEIVARLLKKDAAERYARAEDVIEALDRCEATPGVWIPRPAPDDPSATVPMPSAWDDSGNATQPAEDADDGWGRPEAMPVIEPTEPIPADSTRTVPIRGKVPRRPATLGLATVAVLVASAWLVPWTRLQRLSFAPPGAATPAPDRDTPPPVVPPKPTTAPAGRLLTVSAERAADFRSLLDALGAAQPHDTIEVLDGASYDGPFLIDDPYRFEGVRLVSKAGATLRAAQDNGRMAVLIVDGVRRVRVEGFRVAGATFLHSISLRGNVAGTTLSGLRIVQPADAQWANVLLSRECRGTTDEPILIRGCQFESGKFGIFSGRDDIPDALELSHLWIDGNHFRGPGTHVVLMHSAAGVRIEHNLFEGGRGIEFNLGASRRSGPISVRNNTFYATDSWILFGPDRADYEGVAANNLIVDPSERPGGNPFVSRGASWRVDHNVRESPGSPGETPVDGFGRSTRDAGLRSRDPASPDFVVPRPGGLAATSGAGTPLPSYVGARRPVP